MTQRYGITIPFEGVSLLEHIEWFHRFADLGYSDVWSAEVDGADGFTPLVVAAITEPRLGSSSQPVVERWNGIPFEKPYAKTRDVLRFVKRALDGEKIDEVFETFEVHGFKLSRPVLERPPILLGALRPGMLRLAGREADGAILNWLAATDVEKCRAEVGDGKTIAARLFVIPTEDAATARFIARRMISSYLTVPTYAEFHRWLGRGDALTPMWDAWAAGDRKGANDVIPDSVVDELVIHGSYDACREHVQRYIDAGVEIPTIAIVPFGIDLNEAVEGLAPR